MKTNNNRMATAVFLSAALALSGCSIIPLYSHTNEKLVEAPDRTFSPLRAIQQLFVGKRQGKSPAYLASTRVPWDVDPACRNHWMPRSGFPDEVCRAGDQDLVAIAISGGGSRAAIFAAEVMFELERYGVLQKTDVISCVSGGCLTAAYYVLSCDNPQENCPHTSFGPGAGRLRWDPDTVHALLKQNYIADWIGRWFFPTNIWRFWFTYYDRTDIMAQTLSANLFDHAFLGRNKYLFRDLNPQRPNLVINATNFTARSPSELHFAFTGETFADLLGSDLDQYPVANAVMASATFPGVFNYVTLRDFKRGRYVHLFDGGTSDNLGISAIEKALRPHQGRLLPRKIVFVIDAYLPVEDNKQDDPEPRDAFDYIFDSNVVDAYDTLLTVVRESRLAALQESLGEGNAFVHIALEHLKGQAAHSGLYDVVKGIATTLNADDMDANCLRHAARVLVRQKLAILADDPRFPGLVRRAPMGEPPALAECRKVESTINDFDTLTGA